MIFKKNNKGNYSATNDNGVLVALFKVKDEYGFTQDHEWKWMIDTGEEKYWADHSSYSYEDTAEDLADYINNKFNKEIEYEFE